jgi:hypothetical protein
MNVDSGNLYLTHHCKQGMKNLKIEIIDQHMNATSR